MPTIIQVDRLPRSKLPASEDVDLGKLWSPAKAVEGKASCLWLVAGTASFRAPGGVELTRMPRA